MNEITSDHLITVDEAIKRIDSIAVVPRMETIDLWEADARTLAVGIAADRDSPAFDKSLVDGYALRSADAGRTATLRDVGEIAAGGVFDRTLEDGECIAIMTGAPLPAGADAVCPVESTQANGVSVLIREAVAPGRFIERRGAHWRHGDVLLPAGITLSPAALAVAASVGAANVSVFAQPRVGVLTTGDEIVPFHQTPGPTQLRDSNAILIATLLRRLGCQPVPLGHAMDDPAAIAKVLQTAGLDALCVTGGMSMGRRDYVPQVMRNLGYEFVVTKLRMKPGKPFVVAVHPQTRGVIFGLPGNPVSGFVCVARLASRLLLRMQGRSPEPEWARVNAIDLPPNGPREFYQPAIAEHGALLPLNWRGSADVLTLARANCLIRRPANATAINAGEMLEVIRLP